MRKQWEQFLEDNASVWAYDIVPQLVVILDKALKAGDEATVHEVLYCLSDQGVVLDSEGHLRFSLDFVL